MVRGLALHEPNSLESSMLEAMTASGAMSIDTRTRMCHCDTLAEALPILCRLWRPCSPLEQARLQRLKSGEQSAR